MSPKSKTVSRRGWGYVVMLALVLGGADELRGSAPKPPSSEPPPSFGVAIEVALSQAVIRVVDIGGNPMLGLTPGDLRVRVGKSEIPVLALDWIGDEDGSSAAADAGDAVAPYGALEGGEAGGLTAARPPAAGRLVVVFVQADLNPTRISGQLRLRPYTRRLLATLRPQDRVAVVSFDSHLKLWQDFSQDRVATHAAIDRAMLYSNEVEVPRAAPLSLEEHFDGAAARAAASPERALELVARAMEPLPGEKTLLFLGWGMGRFTATGVHMAPAYWSAVTALRAARAAVFVLDVTSADSHSLATGLENVAAATGGLYFSTFRLPGLATRSLTRAISGYYLLTLDRAAVTDVVGEVRIDLRKKVGTVLGRPLELR